MSNGDPHTGAKKAVIAALFGNLAVAASKFVAYLATNSSAMLAESIHSVADTVNQVFLLLGLRLGRRPPDEEHPFGFGRERFVWAVIVALSIFTLGAVFSFYEGMHWRVRNPGPFWRSLTQTKSPTILVVLFEDSAALLGIAVAACGIGLTMLTGSPLWDGLASVVIGALLLFAALFVGWRTRGLLLGEAATPEDRIRIRNAVNSVDEVEELLEVLTLHLGPEEILVNLNVNFADGLDTDRLEIAVDEIESRIRLAVPAATRIFIEAESLRTMKPKKGPDR